MRRRGRSPIDGFFLAAGSCRGARHRADDPPHTRPRRRRGAALSLSMHQPSRQTDRQNLGHTNCGVHRRRYRPWVTRTSTVSPPAQPEPAQPIHPPNPPPQRCAATCGRSHTIYSFVYKVAPSPSRSGHAPRTAASPSTTCGASPSQHTARASVFLHRGVKIATLS